MDISSYFRCLRRESFLNFLQNYIIPEGPAAGERLGDIATIPQQLIARLLDRRESVVAEKSVQDGITTLAVAYAIYSVLLGRTVVYALPSLNLARVLHVTKVLPAITQAGLEMVGRGEISHSTPQIRFKNGGKLIYRSGAGGEAAQSAITCDLLIIDEAEDFSQQKIELLLKRLVRSRLAQFCIFSTRKTKNGILAELEAQCRLFQRFQLFPDVEACIQREQPISTSGPLGAWCEGVGTGSLPATYVSYNFFVHGDRKLYSLQQRYLSPREYWNAVLPFRSITAKAEFFKNFLGRFIDVQQQPIAVRVNLQPTYEQVYVGIDVQHDRLYVVALDAHHKTIYRDLVLATDPSVAVFEEILRRIPGQPVAIAVDLGGSKNLEQLSANLWRLQRRRADLLVLGARGDVARFSKHVVYKNAHILVEHLSSGIACVRPATRSVLADVFAWLQEATGPYDESDQFWRSVCKARQTLDTEYKEIVKIEGVDFFDAAHYAYLAFLAHTAGYSRATPQRTFIPISFGE